MRIAILGPGGVGGLLAGVLERSGNEVTVVATESTAALIDERGISITSVTFGDFVAAPAAVARLERADRCADRRDEVGGSRAGARAHRDRAAARSAPAQRPRPHRRPARALRALLGDRRLDPRRGRPARARCRRAHEPLPARLHGQRAIPRWRPPMERLDGALARGRRAGEGARLRGPGDVVEARPPERPGLHHERLRQAARRDPRHAGAAGATSSGRSRRRARSGRPRVPRTSMRPSARSPSSSARTRRSAARCSATSPPGANPSSTRSPARCCAPPPGTGSPARRSSGSSALIAARAGHRAPRP